MYHDLGDFHCPDGVSPYSITAVGFLNGEPVVAFKVHIYPPDAFGSLQDVCGVPPSSSVVMVL